MIEMKATVDASRFLKRLDTLERAIKAGGEDGKGRLETDPAKQALNQANERNNYAIQRRTQYRGSVSADHQLEG